MSCLYLSSVNEDRLITIYLVEVESGQVKASLELPSAHADAYGSSLRVPSGGLAYFMNRLWVAGNDCIYKLEPDIPKLQAAYWSSECCSIQQVYKTDGGLEILSHSAGKIFYMDYGGEFKALRDIRETHKINDRFTSLSMPWLLFPDPGLIVNLDTKHVMSTGPGVRTAGFAPMDNGAFLILGRDYKVQAETPKGCVPYDGIWSCILRNPVGIMGFRKDTGEVCVWREGRGFRVACQIAALAGQDVTDILPYGMEI